MTLTASDGVSLEAHLGLPPSPIGGIVICHPHPLYGGDMDNPVVVRVAEVAGDLGLVTLRFNFRGVGGSSGVHDDGRAEQRDVEAALDHLAGVVAAPSALVLAGYSFGAAVAAQASLGSSRGLSGLVLIAPPLVMAGEGPFAGLASFEAPVLVVAGSQDEHCPPEALEALGRRLPRTEVRVIPGANHFFFGKLYPLGVTVATWLAGLKAWQPGGRGRAG